MHFVFLRIPYDDSNETHRTLRFAKDNELTPIFTVSKVVLADGIEKTFGNRPQPPKPARRLTYSGERYPFSLSAFEGIWKKQGNRSPHRQQLGRRRAGTMSNERRLQVLQYRTLL